MSKPRYIYWKDEDMWLGYLEEYPDYMTQGTTLKDLEDHLIDLYSEFVAENIPNVRRAAELPIV